MRSWGENQVDELELLAVTPDLLVSSMPLSAKFAAQLLAAVARALKNRADTPPRLSVHNAPRIEIRESQKTASKTA
ncbi:MAG: hypothetical protein QM760_15650 [Nibricoccus sp.]